MAPFSRTGRTDPLNQLTSAFADQYQLGDEIGHGATAFVYRARDLRRQRDVAVKVLRRELASSIGSERFQREVHIAIGLTHPHILPVLDSGDSDGMLFYVMPLLDGEPLRARMKRERQLSLEDALQITRDIASGLQYAHDRGIVHRDVKPENILLAGQTDGKSVGNSYLADFGLARLVIAASGESLTSSGIAVGTVAYMSPEQSTGTDDVDVRTDQYSLACVLFEMLVGVPPYQGVDARAVMARHRFDPIPRIQHTRDSIPIGIDEAITRAMAKVPADRFKSVSGFMQALDAAMTADMVARAVDSYGHQVSTGRRVKAQHPSAESPAAPDLTIALPARTSRLPFRLTAKRAAVGLGVTAVAIAALTLAQRKTGTPDLDPNLVAIAPFEALDPSLAVWREGMLDLLSRTMDGAGPLRTVPATAVMKTWAGKADRESASRLARSTGAGLALFGVMTPFGVDSVWVALRVLDVASDRIVADVEVTDALSRIGRWQSGLTMSALKQLAAVRPVGSAPVYSLGSTSLPALKAFLQGEQHFRRTAFDSAEVYYERALTADSTFALPLYRLYGIQIWRSGGIDPTRALRAGALNRGLPPKDSLLIVAESLSAAFPPSAFASDSVYWSHVRRILGSLNEAARRYAKDPEVWYSLAVAQLTYGHALGYSSAQILELVDRSIGLDSSFAPAYLSGILLATRMGNERSAREYASAYLRHGPAGTQAEAIKLMLALGAGDSSRRHMLIDTAAQGVLFAAYNKLAWSTDSAKVAIQIARELSRRSPGMSRVDSVIANFDLAFALAWRGKVAAAYLTIGNQPSRLFGSLAILGGVPRDTAARVFEKLLSSPLWPPTPLPMAVAWWAKQRDTVALQSVLRAAEATMRTPPHRMAGEYAKWLSGTARAHIMLVRGDTAAAIDRFKALPDTACPVCFSDQVLLARLLINTGQVADAQRLLEKDLTDAPGQNNPLCILWELERGRLAERLADRPKALRHYGLVEAAWNQAETTLRWALDSARLGRARLTRR